MKSEIRRHLPTIHHNGVYWPNQRTFGQNGPLHAFRGAREFCTLKHRSDGVGATSMDALALGHQTDNLFDLTDDDHNCPVN
jgi:hypothetical protein